MSKSNLITTERYFVCLFRSSTPSSPSHITSGLEFFPGSSRYQSDQQNDWLKLYCKTQNNMKSSKRRFSGSSTPSVLVTMTDAPMWQIIYLPGSFPGPGAHVSCTTHASPCAWTLFWRRPTPSLCGKAKAHLCGWTALRMSQQGWD